MMRLSKKLVLSTALLCSFSAAVYAAIPNTDKPTTFLGPTLHAGFTSSLTDTSGYSFAAEGGVKNARVNGTVGLDIFQHQRIKLSGEYVWQNLQYSFFSGDNYRGVTQGAVGIDYQYDLSTHLRYHPLIGLNAYYSNAAASSLSPTMGTYLNAAGVPVTFTDYRRMSGSNATGISPTFAMQPWSGTKTSLALNYDDVRFGVKYQPSLSAKGFGGTVRIDQQLTTNVEVGVSAAIRQPFNDYVADIAWNNLPYLGTWVLKLVGEYTAGKSSLPNSYNVSVAVDYFMDMQQDTGRAKRAKEALLVWLSQPAVTMPEVLAVTDDNVTTS